MAEEGAGGGSERESGERRGRASGCVKAFALDLLALLVLDLLALLALSIALSTALSKALSKAARLCTHARTNEWLRPLTKLECVPALTKTPYTAPRIRTLLLLLCVWQVVVDDCTLMWELECLVPLLLIQGGGGGGLSRSGGGGRPAAVLVGDPMAALASTLHGPHEVLVLLA